MDRAACSWRARTSSSGTFGIDLDQIHAADGFERTVNAILVSDDVRQKYLAHTNLIDRLYSAILPDVKAIEFSATRRLLVILAVQLRAHEAGDDVPDIDTALAEAEATLDQSIKVKYVIRETGRAFDLSRIDWDSSAAANALRFNACAPASPPGSSSWCSATARAWTSTSTSSG